MIKTRRQHCPVLVLQKAGPTHVTELATPTAPIPNIPMAIVDRVENVVADTEEARMRAAPPATTGKFTDNDFTFSKTSKVQIRH